MSENVPEVTDVENEPMVNIAIPQSVAEWYASLTFQNGGRWTREGSAVARACRHAIEGEAPPVAVGRSARGRELTKGMRGLHESVYPPGSRGGP